MIKKELHVDDDLTSLLKTKVYRPFRLQAFANDNSNVAPMTGFVVDRVKNILGKEENAVYQHFLLSPK